MLQLVQTDLDYPDFRLVLETLYHQDLPWFLAGPGVLENLVDLRDPLDPKVLAVPADQVNLQENRISVTSSKNTRNCSCLTTLVIIIVIINIMITTALIITIYH